MPSFEKALEAKDRVKELLKNSRGVNGIGVAWDTGKRPCVRVNVEEWIDLEDRRRIPTEILGVPVSVQTIVIDAIDSEA